MAPAERGIAVGGCRFSFQLSFHRHGVGGGILWQFGVCFWFVARNSHPFLEFCRLEKFRRGIFLADSGGLADVGGEGRGGKGLM